MTNDPWVPFLEEVFSAKKPSDPPLPLVVRVAEEDMERAGHALRGADTGGGGILLVPESARSIPLGTTPTEKRDTMPSATHNHLRRQLAESRLELQRLSGTIANLETELAKADRPDAPASDVIAFAKQFEEGGIRYNYAARRAGNGRWYTTGATCPERGYSWEQLLDFIEKDNILPTSYGVLVRDRAISF